LLTLFNKFKAMGYYDNPDAKRVIDCVLRRNAIMFANLGADSPKKEYEKAKVEERQRLRKVRRYDTEMIDKLIAETIDHVV
jgi:hypothetical protein